MSESPGDADLIREIERVADRLRVLGPRWASATAAGSAGQGTSGEPSGPERVREALQRLADLAADAEGRVRRDVPPLAPRALADQVLVLGHDLATLAAPGALSAGHAVLVELRRAL
ncbi:MAG TPA: hypothetical protein VFP72_12075 [Kineosporiaceae bacterium]|nr:hypothetical protein [Kineosporiaceae bacterium]